MKNSKKLLMALFLTAIIFTGCKSLNNTQKGAGIGTVAGGAAGAVIGRASGNTAMGAVIGAAVGGVTGAVIGNQMDKQAAEIKKEVPDANVVRVGEGIVIEFSSNILFGFDKSSLTSEAKENLGSLVKILNKYPDTDIEIDGHTDNKGTANYNQRLSEQRTDAVTKYLVSKNISSLRLNSVGFGEDKPKYTNNTEEGRSQNRRVEFAITANEKMKREAQQEADKNGK